MRLLLFSVILLALFSSCGKKNRFSDVDLSNSPVSDVKIQRFDRDFFAVDTNNVASSLAVLREKYGSFVDLYTKRIIGNPQSKENDLVYQFLTHTAYREFYSDCQAKYTNVADLEANFTTAFKYAKYYFPAIAIPNIYTHVSGFGDVIVVDEGLVSVSLDYYLGADYKNYEHVDGIYSYMIPNFRRDKIVPDVVFWWLTTEFPDNIEIPRLLENMIYYGKIMYLTEVFLPNDKEENLMGYTREQWNWCKANESKIWNYIVESKHLFSSEILLTAKYINPAPFTSFFPEESPGRIGIWVGWQIVRAYMDKNKSTTLPELMNNFNAQDILEKSGYKP